MKRVFATTTLVIAVVFLAGCGSPRPQEEGTVQRPGLSSTSPLCLQLANTPGRVGEGSYPTDRGRLRLHDGRIELVADSTTVLADGVERLVDVREVDGATNVFYTVRDGEESDLMVVDPDGTSTRIAVGDAPEYSVIAVAGHPDGDRWVLTAVADLTEVIVEVDRTGREIRTITPYEYNKPPFLILAEPLEDEGFFLLEAEEGDEAGWSVALLTATGELRTRLPLPTNYGRPTGWYDRVRAGEVVVGTERGSLVIGYENATFTFTECATRPLDRLVRR